MPGWLTLPLTVVGLCVAYWMSKRSANAAEESVVQARRSSDAVEAALALQREEAEERRQAAQPSVNLVLTRASGPNTLVLMNEGDASAVNVRLEPPDPMPLRLTFPDGGVTLAPGQEQRFMMNSSLQRPMPQTLRFTWDDQEEPVTLSVPSKRG